MTTADRPSWRTSTRSSNGEACVEVAPVADGVLVRHSKSRAGGTIHFSFAAWTAFVGEALDGATGANGVATIAVTDGEALVRCADTGVALRFDAEEWSAFRAGAAAGEFTATGLLASA